MARMDIWRLLRKEVCYEKTVQPEFTEHTGLVLVVFLILTVVCAALKPLIGVNYDMNDYLPPDSAALFSVTIAEESGIDACSAIREIIGDDNAMAGSAFSTAVATTSTVTEISSDRCGSCE